MTTPPARVVAAVALGGALGACLRALLAALVPDGSGFPWTTFTINVLGSLALAAVPALGAVRRSPSLAAGLGPGLLGGFTTLSAAAEQARTLVADGDAPLAAAYLVGTLAAALVAVALVSRWVGQADEGRFADEEGDR